VEEESREYGKGQGYLGLGRWPPLRVTGYTEGSICEGSGVLGSLSRRKHLFYCSARLWMWRTTIRSLNLAFRPPHSVPHFPISLPLLVTSPHHANTNSQTLTPHPRLSRLVLRLLTQPLPTHPRPVSRAKSVHLPRARGRRVPEIPARQGICKPHPGRRVLALGVGAGGAVGQFCYGV
jgi:hypothetical protein